MFIGFRTIFEIIGYCLLMPHIMNGLGNDVLNIA